MKINGGEMPIHGNITLENFLEEQQYTLTQIAVERNGQIVKKEDYATTILEDSDVLEIVSFVGGG